MNIHNGKASHRILCTCVALLAWITACSPARTAHEQYRLCVRVIDGDTVVLQSSNRAGVERVRLLGVDAPELHRPGTPAQYFARASRAFVTRLLKGRKVRLEYDWQRTDRHDRTLAYLFLEDGTDVNLEIIRKGYAVPLTRHPFRRIAEFRAAGQIARQRSIGLWAHPDSIGIAESTKRR